MTSLSADDAEDLFRLIVQYSEDYSLFFADERAAFDEFADRVGEDCRPGALRELDRLLATATTEEQLERSLNTMAFAYVVQTGGSPSNRAFLLRLRGWLVESLATRPPSPAS